MRLLLLEPGAVVPEHKDPMLALHIKKSMIRLTIPIQNDNTTFLLNGKHVDMKEGECWYLRLSDTHSVENHASTHRLNLTIDIIPNQWIREIIEKSIQGIEVE